MTTKDQERKALERMKKIVAELGPQSYIGTAFEGAWELAEQNIDWDAAYSVTNSIESANKGEAKAKAEAQLAKEKAALEVKASMKRVEEAVTELDIAKNRQAEAERCADALREQVRSLDADVCRLDGECMKWQKRLEESEQEIMKLKAMLFDLMYGKKVAG